MITSEVRDGRLYLLCFEELARFLVFNSMYRVLFGSYNRPAIRVNTYNFDWCLDLVKKAEGTSDCNFIIEFELPALEVKISENYNGLMFSVNSNPKYNPSFQGISFDDLDIWREKEIEKRCKKLGSYQQLEKIREEVDNEIKQLPNAE